MTVLSSTTKSLEYMDVSSLCRARLRVEPEAAMRN